MVEPLEKRRKPTQKRDNDEVLWAWGCGSNDGRCGVERFLNMAGEGKPPRVDSMKCYLMGPHRVGVARPVYWPHGPSLDGVHVRAVATGRNHMACIGVPGTGMPGAVVHRTLSGGGGGGGVVGGGESLPFQRASADGAVSAHERQVSQVEARRQQGQSCSR